MTVECIHNFVYRMFTKVFFLTISGQYNAGKYGTGVAPVGQPQYARASAQASAGFRQPYKF